MILTRKTSPDSVLAALKQTLNPLRKLFTVLRPEVPKAPPVQSLPNFRGQLIIKIEVVQYRQPEGQGFLRLEQVPEIGNEWSDYVKDVSEGGAYLYERMAGYSPEDVYRDYEKTEYLGKYYLVYVGEMWEDHSVNWEYFYVSENFDEVLWYDHIARLDNEYPVLYLDEWRNSDFYPALGK